MKLVDYFDDLCTDAEAEGNKEMWIRAAAVALVIASKKNAKHLAAYWAEEAVGCIAEADAAAAAEEFDNLLYYDPWRVREEVTVLFEKKYYSLGEVLKELP